MKAIKTLTSAQVLKRMRQGEKMFPIGWASEKGIFDDGEKVSSKVIMNLLKSEKIERPTGTCISNPFTLVGLPPAPDSKPPYTLK